jgi:hypothetical protein
MIEQVCGMDMITCCGCWQQIFIFTVRTLGVGKNVGGCELSKARGIQTNLKFEILCKKQENFSRLGM